VVDARNRENVARILRISGCGLRGMSLVGRYGPTQLAEHLDSVPSGCGSRRFPSGVPRGERLSDVNATVEANADIANSHVVERGSCEDRQDSDRGRDDLSVVH
jgi:hypothetical protein